MTTRIVAKNNNDLKLKLTDLLNDILKERAKTKSLFYIGLSGGSQINLLCEILNESKFDYENWRIFFCDERVVPFESPDSNFGQYLNKIGHLFRPDQFFPIEENVSADFAAITYTVRLHEQFGTQIPQFDLLLLGIGHDGHTCSIFPNHISFHNSMPHLNKWIIAINDAPKPPASRVTMTFTLINNAKNCIFIVNDPSKASILKEIIVNKNQSFPATMVRPKHGHLYWLIDQQANVFLG